MLSAAPAGDERGQAEIIVLVLQFSGLKAAGRMAAYLDRMADFLRDLRAGGKTAEGAKGGLRLKSG